MKLLKLEHVLAERSLNESYWSELDDSNDLSDRFSDPNGKGAQDKSQSDSELDDENLVPNDGLIQQFHVTGKLVTKAIWYFELLLQNSWCQLLPDTLVHGLQNWLKSHQSS